MRAWSSEQITAASRAVMETRVRWGWTFGYKRHRVMALDQLIASAVLAAVS